MKNIIITNPEKVEKIKQSIIKDGVKKLHIISDFDRTLTKAFIEEERRPSLISILRDGDYLTSDYREKAHALFDKYSKIESDLSISLEKRREAMKEWWQTHFDLLIKSGLNKEDLVQISQSDKIQLREGSEKFFNTLHKKNIPLLVMSSSGVGDAIVMFLEKKGYANNNVHIISNFYQWDEQGKAIDIKKPIIHILNKNETLAKNYPVFKKIENRKNVILLGDSLSDVEMIEGFDCENIIKIGFLNENIEENLEEYKKTFDVVVLNDGDMEYINELLANIIKL